MADEPTRATPDLQAAQPNAALARLNALVGQWQWEAFAGSESIGRGRSTFEWLEGSFLIEHADAETPNFPSGTSVIGGDETTEAYCMLQFDSRGISRLYQMALGERVWKLWRDAPGFWQRFTGMFSDDGSSIRGRWEQSDDGSSWTTDFDLIYTKRR